MKKNEVIKRKLVGALAIGRLNQEGNSYMLWFGEWDKLRRLIYSCFEIIDKATSE